MQSLEKALFFLTVCISCLFLCSCGLDEYYIIEPPHAKADRTSNDTDTLNSFFWFSCPSTNAQISSGLNIQGVGVYYKIYTSENTLKSEMSSIKSANKEYSENGFLKIDPDTASSFNYQLLKFTDTATGRDFEFIPLTNNEQSARIHLWNVGGTKGLSIAANDTDTPQQKGTISKDFSFETLKAEIDTASGEETTDLFVAMYAVTVGNDTSLHRRYSQLAVLGYLKVPAGSN